MLFVEALPSSCWMAHRAARTVPPRSSVRSRSVPADDCILSVLWPQRWLAEKAIHNANL